MRPTIIFGGYGTFGTHVSRELARYETALTIAGRDRTRAETFARTLGRDCSVLVADVNRPDSCRAALEGHGVVVNCTGPFKRSQGALLEACLDAGCHYVDIADDRDYAALVRSQGQRFHERGLTAVYGCSSLPGISGALALLAREGTRGPVARVRVTLFIGNKNPKGWAAVRSLLAGLGQTIIAPQGTVRGFRDREVVSLPAPFGRRAVFNFESPEYDLFPILLGARSVSVKVGFELRLGTCMFAVLARLGSSYGDLTARLLALPGRALSRVGCSGGVVMTELFCADGSVRWAALAGRQDGQRMAALPCALVAHALSNRPVPPLGAMTAYEFLGARPLLEGLTAAGFTLHTELQRR